MDLATRYIGMSLKGPFIVGASPLIDDVETAAALETAGASALVMHSLFEEQIDRPERESALYDSAATYFPDESAFSLTPGSYAKHLKRLKEAVRIPIIGSLNGVTPSGWVRYAQFIEASGADALELNAYGVPTNADCSSGEVERQLLNLVAAVRSAIHVPLSVKLAPFYSSLPNLARRLATEGADGIVLFNRSYYPAIQVQDLTVTAMPDLSGPWELSLRLRWLGILYGKVNVSLAVTGGVHSAEDAVKSILAGADAIQVVSVLLKNGPNYLKELIAGLRNWMASQKFEGFDQCRGLLSLANCPDPDGYERGTYALGLQGWNMQKRRVKP
jgi:dihydroorotate dehydrogenase (fumarate)